LKITHVKVGQFGVSNNRGKRHVTICSELAEKNEFMTITVTVQYSGADGEVRASGIARAKDFARRFADSPMALFPTDVPIRRIA
jgi:hypothetical protein